MIREKSDPLALFGDWYEEAAKSEPNDPSAMSVATVGPDGTPSLRMVLLKGYDAAGFVFYTNTESRKGRICWRSPRRRCCSTGSRCAGRCAWKGRYRRPRPRRPMPISPPAPAAARSAPGRRTSRGRWRAASRWRSAWRRFTARHVIGKVPRPPHWSGFRLQPLLIEFWQDGAFRLHDRLEYRRAAPGEPWTTRTLYP